MIGLHAASWILLSKFKTSTNAAYFLKRKKVKHVYQPSRHIVSSDVNNKYKILYSPLALELKTIIILTSKRNLNQIPMSNYSFFASLDLLVLSDLFLEVSVRVYRIQIALYNHGKFQLYLGKI